MRGREYHGHGEEYNVEEGKEEAISSSLKYQGCWEEYKVGKEDENLGEENQDF